MKSNLGFLYSNRSYCKSTKTKICNFFATKKEVVGCFSKIKWLFFLTKFSASLLFCPIFWHAAELTHQKFKLHTLSWFAPFWPYLLWFDDIAPPHKPPPPALLRASYAHQGLLPQSQHISFSLCLTLSVYSEFTGGILTSSQFFLSRIRSTIVVHNRKLSPPASEDISSLCIIIYLPT